MTDLFRWPSFLAVLATLLVSGWVHGLWSGRWAPDHELVAAVDRLEDVPMQVGEWTAETQTVDDGEFFQAGAMSYWTRRYTHARTREVVTVILMCGRAGRMSVHTPEVCYQGAGFAMAGTPQETTVAWQEISHECSGSFWTALFRKEGATPSRLRLLWAWNSRGNWQALTQPRWETKGEPFLYKMYVSLEGIDAEPVGQAGNLRPDTDDLQRTKEFLREFLPQLQKTLFPRQEETSSRHP